MFQRLGKSLNLSVARSCFVRCRGCYNHFGAPGGVIDTPAITSFIVLARGYGFTKLTLCGGDPLARPDVLDIAEFGKETGYRVHLDTVGTPLVGTVKTIFFGQQTIEQVDAHRLARVVDLVGIPVDGHNQETASQFRGGRENFFYEQMQVLALLDAAGASVCINTVVHRGNIDHLHELDAVLRMHESIVRWQLFEFSPTGPLGFRNRHEFQIPAGAFDSAVASLIADDRDRVFKLEPKSNVAREGNYLLVDSDGTAWTPVSFSEPGSDRRVLGSIVTPDDARDLLEMITVEGVLEL